MRPSLLLCSLLLCLGCARSAEPRPDDAASPPSESGAPSVAAPAGAAPSRDAGGEAQAAECRTDSDCTITLVPEGECCSRLCSGRSVPVAEGQALEARVRECQEQGKTCIIPPCAPPRTRPVAVCTGGRCGVREVPRELP